ncbi:hypothetical protein TYRP_022495 [Tyrophagus putrescentiae]|nr:hypothetical protein TYRP_022495 [Tyrophagus putrescentiae]
MTAERWKCHPEAPWKPSSWRMTTKTTPAATRHKTTTDGNSAKPALPDSALTLPWRSAWTSSEPAEAHESGARKSPALRHHQAGMSPSSDGAADGRQLCAHCRTLCRHCHHSSSSNKASGPPLSVESLYLPDLLLLFFLRHQWEAAVKGNHFPNVVVVVEVTTRCDATALLHQQRMMMAGNVNTTAKNQTRTQLRRPISTITCHRQHTAAHSTSPLCLPVNPVAILKSQLAKSSGIPRCSIRNQELHPHFKMLEAAAVLPTPLRANRTYQSYASTRRRPRRRPR